MNHQESLASYHFHKVTMLDGRMYGAPTLVRLVDLLDKRCGVKVNRTAILNTEGHAPTNKKRQGLTETWFSKGWGCRTWPGFPGWSFAPFISFSRTGYIDTIVETSGAARFMHKNLTKRRP